MISPDPSKPKNLMTISSALAKNLLVSGPTKVIASISLRHCRVDLVDEASTSASESRCQWPKSCEWCGGTMTENICLDAKYCGGRCRHQAAVDRANSGRVYRTQLLKNGMVSIVIHAENATLAAAMSFGGARTDDGGSDQTQRSGETHNEGE